MVKAAYYYLRFIVGYSQEQSSFIFKKENCDIWQVEELAILGHKYKGGHPKAWINIYER